MENLQKYKIVFVKFVHWFHTEKFGHTNVQTQLLGIRGRTSTNPNKQQLVKSSIWENS